MSDFRVPTKRAQLAEWLALKCSGPCTLGTTTEIAAEATKDGWPFTRLEVTSVLFHLEELGYVSRESKADGKAWLWDLVKVPHDYEQKMNGCDHKKGGGRKPGTSWKSEQPITVDDDGHVRTWTPPEDGRFHGLERDTVIVDEAADLPTMDKIDAMIDEAVDKAHDALHGGGLTWFVGGLEHDKTATFARYCLNLKDEELFDLVNIANNEIHARFTKKFNKSALTTDDLLTELKARIPD